MAQLATASAKSGAEAKVKDAIDNLRSAAQDLHKQITDAAARKSGATKADIAALTEKAKSLAKSAKASIDTQQGNVAKHLTDAVEHLEATQANLSDSLKATGTALDTSVKKVLAEARASVQELSEAVAEKRAANSAKKSQGDHHA
jgi:exonuclease VII small subunit